MYAGVPYPNADDRALSMAASSARTSGLPNRFRTVWGSKASRLVMHFCNRSIVRRFCRAVRIGDRVLGGGTGRRAMGSPICDKGHYHIYCRPNCRRAWYCSLAVAGPRARQVALGLNDAGRIVEARRRIGVFPAEPLLADPQPPHRAAAPSHCRRVNPPVPPSWFAHRHVLKKLFLSLIDYSPL